MAQTGSRVGRLLPVAISPPQAQRCEKWPELAVVTAFTVAKATTPGWLAKLVATLLLPPPQLPPWPLPL
jgi:hypothetical protein